MFALWLSFSVALELSLSQISTLIILAFMEYLQQARMSASNITNHLTVIRSLCIIYNCDISMLRDKRIPLFIKAVKLNRPVQRKYHFVIDKNILCAIANTSSQLQQLHTFIALYLLAFFSFLRLSNILPHSGVLFDISRHLCTGDVIFGKNSALLVIKWSKTLQDTVSIVSVSLSLLVSSSLCPVTALLTMLCGCQHKKDEPFFQDKFQRGTPLTDSVARKHL